MRSQIQWKEVSALAGLLGSVVISWIAYQEYQPQLLADYKLTHLTGTLIMVKGLVLVFVPVIAGWITDKLLSRKKNYFFVFTLGISITAMIFMIVASTIGFGSDRFVVTILPIMIILWLIAMNIFLSPASSFIELFAPVQKLPVVMGILALVLNSIESIEPVVIILIRYLGTPLTFTVGGILILVSGFIFKQVTSGAVLQRKQEAIQVTPPKTNYRIIFLFALLLGISKAFLAEFIPSQTLFGNFKGEYLSFICLFLAAWIAFGLSFYIDIKRETRYLIICLVSLAIGSVLLTFTHDSIIFILGALLLAFSLGLLQIIGLPFAIKQLNSKNITYGVGLFIGASELPEALYEVLMLT